MQSTDTIRARLLAKSTRDPETGCLRWTGACTKTGYGNIRLSRVTHLTHRVSYALEVGEIPDGMEIDHVYAAGCRHRDCFEPTHLEAVTHAENLARAFRTPEARDAASRRHDAITQCPRGHEYTPENSVLNSDGRRACKQCKYQSTELYRSQKARCPQCGRQVTNGNLTRHERNMHG